MIRFIHAADLHLGRPMRYLNTFNSTVQDRLQQATRASFERLIDTAIDEAVDFVLLAGDIYDGATGALSDQFFLNEQLGRLGDADIPTFLLFGNHDHDNLSGSHIDLPQSVYIFPAEVETTTLTTKAGETVALSGFSYDRQWIDADRVADYPDKRPDEDYHIGLLHGAEATGDATLDHYAPFAVADLEQHGYDYWALGHIHKTGTVHDNPAIWYAGNIQGTRANETGPKGALLVSIDKGQVPDVTPIATTDFEFVNQPVDGNAIDSVEALRQVIEQALNDAAREARADGVQRLTTVVIEIASDRTEALKYYAEHVDALASDKRRQTPVAPDGGALLYQVKLSVSEPETAPAYAYYDATQLNAAVDAYADDEAALAQVLEPLLSHADWRDTVLPNIDRAAFYADVIQRAKDYIAVNRPGAREE